MTLTPYSPDQIDQLALRLLDVAGTLRQMANRCRENDFEGYTLHDKKALEWCAALQRWAHKSSADLEMQIIDARATRRAASITAGP
jgi:hypothetical protein